MSSGRDSAVGEQGSDGGRETTKAAKRSASRGAATPDDVRTSGPGRAGATEGAAKKAAARKAPAKKAPAERATGKKANSGEGAGSAGQAPSTEKSAPTGRGTPTKKAPAAKKAVAEKPTPAKKAPSAGKAAPTGRATPTKKAPAAKKASPAARKAAAGKKAPPAQKAPPAKKTAPLKKAPAPRKQVVAPKKATAAVSAAPARTVDPHPRGESRTALVRRARRIDRELAEVYPYAHPELDFENPFQLVVATVLSAQTTDLRVNQTTPGLFAKYPTPEDLAAANPEEVEEILRPTGFFRAKTRSVIGLSKALVEQFGGEVPGRLEDLVKLPGVGRKTAFVVLGNAFGFAT